MSGKVPRVGAKLRVVPIADDATRRNSILLAAIFVLMVIGNVPVATVVAATKPIPGGESIVVEAPVFQIGDECRYVGGRFRQVVGFEDDLTIMAENWDSFCEGCHYFYDKNLARVKVLDRNARPTGDPRGGLKFVDFPLRVGKEWNQKVEARQAGTGALREYFNRFKIETYEEVTVKAGTFKAFRIAWHQERHHPAPGWSGDAQFWWSPETKCGVKGLANDPRWFAPYELESYTLK